MRQSKWRSKHDRASESHCTGPRAALCPGDAPYRFVCWTITSCGILLPSLWTHDKASAKRWSPCAYCHYRSSMQRCHQYTTTGLATSRTSVEYLSMMILDALSAVEHWLDAQPVPEETPSRAVASLAVAQQACAQ